MLYQNKIIRNRYWWGRIYAGYSGNSDCRTGDHLPPAFWGQQVEIIIVPTRNQNEKIFRKKNLRGCLRQYAKPDLIGREAEAWQDAVKEKHVPRWCQYRITIYPRWSSGSFSESRWNFWISWGSNAYGSHVRTGLCSSESVSCFRRADSDKNMRLVGGNTCLLLKSLMWWNKLYQSVAWKTLILLMRYCGHTIKSKEKRFSPLMINYIKAWIQFNINYIYQLNKYEYNCIRSGRYRLIWAAYRLKMSK